MTKHDDTLANAAARKLPEPPPVPPGERLHGIPGKVTAADLAVIRRAIVLQLATVCDLDDDSAESAGRALGSICRQYLLHERSTRHANAPTHPG